MTLPGLVAAEDQALCPPGQSRHAWCGTRIYTRGEAVTITDTFFVVCSNLLIAFSSVDVSLKRAFLLVFGRQSFSSRLTGAVDAATEVPP